MTHIDDRGAVQEACGSRVLESALMLALLHRERIYPGTQESLACFLRSHREDRALTALERQLADICLSDRPPQVEVEALLGGFEHFTAARKRLMFNTYLMVLGATPPEEKVDLSAVGYHGHASWVGVTLSAVKILNAYGRGRPDLVSEQDREFLISQVEDGSRREVWEGHLSAHLLALHAVTRFLPGSRLVREDIDRILQHRNPDGGLPFITDMNVWLTALAGLALTRVDADPALLRRMGDYLAIHQAPDGGWSYTESVAQTDVDDTSCSAEFLSALDQSRYADELNRAGQYLTRIANQDGGFPTYRREHASEATMTANAISALAPDWDRHTPLLEPAVVFLLQAQKPDGTFERSWSSADAYAISRVLHALSRVPHRNLPRFHTGISQASTLALRYLESAQNPDGGWGHSTGDPSDPISTAHALTASLSSGNAPWRLSGLCYLMNQQDPDGGFTSIPDQAAPRPIPYDFPVLADIFVLNALGSTHHLLSQGAHPRERTS
ncbi:prenyltransferase/squalene oxidase repeat-containing protein [Streptomyces sp. NPDC050095]|uniref:prenyltransferase/squalene oxidase repeat-containing protein n=1 Tax=unclassified Streptomyces TaxID=2593676 RepID=UPI0034418001